MQGFCARARSVVFGLLRLTTFLRFAAHAFGNGLDVGLDQRVVPHQPLDALSGIAMGVLL